MVNKSNLKPSLSFDDQLEYLIKEIMLKVYNKENALEVLKREKFYKLSRYWIDYIDEHNHLVNA